MAGLGRLAVDRRFHGRGYGRFLLADALLRAVRSEIASFAVVVDAKDDAARRFYERESFLPLLDEPMKLFRPVVDLVKLFKVRERLGETMKPRQFTVREFRSKRAAEVGSPIRRLCVIRSGNRTAIKVLCRT